MESEVLLIFFAFVLTAPQCHVTEGATWYVRPDGTNETECPINITASSLHNCKNLSEYARDVDRYFTNDTVIEFLDGNHSLLSLLVVYGVHNLSLIGRPSGQSTTIQCNIHSEHRGGFIFNDCSHIHLYNIVIVSCGARDPGYHYSTLSFQRVTNISIKNVEVSKGKGFGLSVNKCIGKIIVEKSSFHNNKGLTYSGGNAKFTYKDCPMNITNILVINSSNFTEGKSHNDYMTRSKASGIVIVSYCNNYLEIKMEQVRVENNLGGNIAFIMKDSTYEKYWNIVIDNCLVASGIGKNGAGLFFMSKFYSHEYNRCSRNGSNILRVMRTNFSSNTVMNDGGAFLVNIHDSDCTPHQIEITDSIFCHNLVTKSSGHSSAIKIQKDSIPGFYTRTLPIHKFRLSRTIFLYNTINVSELTQVSVMEVLNVEKMEISDCNFTDNIGTAMSLRASNVIFSGKVVFENNAATNGGALKFCESSAMFINSNTTMIFRHNRANATGGAIFSQQPCLDEPTACFFQPNVNTSWVSSLKNESHILLEFINNSALIAGDAIYGGDIENCYTYNKFITQEGEQPSFFASHKIFETIFDMNAQDDNSSMVASDPFKVSFCEPNVENESLNVIPGKVFHISMVAKGQHNGVVPATINGRILNKSLQNTTTIHMDHPIALPKICGLFNLTLKMKYHISKQPVILQFEVEHISASIGQDKNAYIHLSVQECPWGFQLKDGVCDCSYKYGYNCNLQKLIIIKNLVIISWMGCQASKNKSLCRNDIILMAKNCGRFGYCDNSISEFKEETIDSQCAQGRTGVLCGECKRNLSLMLGTSRCKPCSNKYVGLIVVYLVAGILLIVILTAFNFTVTNGTLYGLIFYANFIHANHATLFPRFYNEDILRIFIAWLNIDFGIEVCLYNGLDAYQMTWLQFGYIFYMWTLQVIIVILCRRYVFFTRMFGRNVTKVLSTLILLCFSKAMQTIQDTLEFTTLLSITSKNHQIHILKYFVTSLDGNMEYLSPEHIPQFVFAIFLMIVLLIFSLCLVFIKILTSLSSARCFGWVARLLPFFDTFTGPCNQNYAFWPGLLFFIRGSLYLTYATKAKYPDFQLIITGCAAALIIVLSFLTPKGVYKKWSLNLLELSYILNLSFTCGLVAFMNNTRRPDKKLISAISHVSVSIALISFVVFHFRNHFRTLTVKCCSGALKMLHTKKKQKKELQNIVTHSEVCVSVESQDGERDPLLPISGPPVIRAYDNFRESLMEDN